MIVELLSVVAVFAGGCLFVRAAGLTGWSIPAFGLLAGLCLQTTIGFVQVVTSLPTSPVLTLALTFGLPAAWWLVRWRGGHDVGLPVGYAVLSLAVVAAAVPVLRAANLVKWHSDSFTYVMGGAILADGTYDTAVSAHHLTKRLLAVSLIHAPASLTDDYYLRAITPLLAVATVGMLVWFFLRGAPERLDPGQLAIFAGLGALVLVTNNRFIFSAFYINGHLLVAVLLLAIAGGGWLLATRDQVPARPLMALQILAIPALVVTRPEATVLAGVALLPMLLSERVSWRHRATAMAVLGTSTMAWQGFVWWMHHQRDAEVPITVSGPFMAGLALLPGIWLLGRRPLLRRSAWVLWLTEAGTWLVLAAFFVRSPQIMIDSVDATWQNLVLGAGKWGTFPVVLAALVVVAIIVVRSPQLSYLRFPVTVFLPLAFVEAYLRDEAYRVGYGDSLSRMFMHIVPLAVLYIMAAYASADVSSRWARRPTTTTPELSAETYHSQTR
jgi:hypothetical protein